MSKKLLLVSLVNIDPKDYDYETVSEEWAEYNKRGILRQLSSALFLYLSAKSFSLQNKLLNYEKLRVKKKVNSLTYPELFSEFDKNNKKSDSNDRIMILLKELIKRFNLSKYINVERELTRVVNHGTEVYKYIIELPLEVAVLIDVNDLINNDKIKSDINNGIITISGLETGGAEDLLNIIIKIYTGMIQQLINQNRSLILSKYHSDAFEKIAEEEHAYEYKMVKYPPCIEKALSGDIPEGHRNNVLFALANFLKASVISFGNDLSKEEIKEMIWQANNNMPNPLPESEVNSLIRYHIDEKFYQNYGWCSKMKEAGLCEEKNFSTCLRKYFKRQGIKNNKSKKNKKHPKKITS